MCMQTNGCVLRAKSNCFLPHFLFSNYKPNRKENQPAVEAATATKLSVEVEGIKKKKTANTNPQLN